MNTIQINNDYSYLITENQELKQKLWTALRFKARNYFHNRAYKCKLWDGFVNYFDRKTGRFLTGLLPEILFALKHFNIDYQTVDERNEVNFKIKKIDDQFLNKWLPEGMKPVTLEDYQVDFTNQAIKHKRGIVKSPTGSGKTYILISIIKCLPPGTPVLFLVNRTNLVTQNYKEMIKWGIKNVGRFDGKHKDPNIITCATVQSIKHLEKELHKFKVLIVDEVHLMMSPKTIKAYKKLTGCNVRISLSATPFKFGESDKVHKYNVKGYFGPIFKTSATESGELTTSELQDRERLSKSKCTFFPIEYPQIPFHVYMDAVTEGIAKSFHFHEVVSKLVKQLKGRTLILVERIAHGDYLNNMIPGSLWVQGKDDEESREYVINKLKEIHSDVVAIATRQIFDTGLNFYLMNLVNAAGGQADHQIVQMMGRGLRPAEDKELLNYYDFIFKINPYLEDHSNKRVRILRAEGHEVIVKNKVDF
jgi:superfamily II DNA or RNA helicase